MIKNVIFDLGKVLINWDLDNFSKSYTSDPKLQKSIVDDIFTHNDWHMLDKGAITEEEAELRFSERLSLTKEEIRIIIAEARKIMTLKTKTYTELKRLKKNYNIFCISNMSHKSWEVVQNEHSFIDYFDDIVISAEVKMIKPAKEIFSYALNKFKIDPNESIFIDDLKDNILSAQSLGIKGILFDESEKCWDEIKSL